MQAHRNNQRHGNPPRIRQLAAVLLLFSLTVQSFSPVSLTPSYSHKTPLSTTQLDASRWRSKLTSAASRIGWRTQKKRPARKPYQPGRPTSYQEESHSVNPLKEDDDDVSVQATVVTNANDETFLDKLTTTTTTQQTTTTTVPSTDDANKSTSSSPSVDLTGSWKLRVHDAFLQQYQEYLTQLGQPFWVRSIALSIVARTTEETRQTRSGESLWIKGTNVRGTWERTLLTTASDATLLTADGETVAYEAWWEGPVHVSWLRGVQKYGGGSFESRRYLEKNDNINCLVCESTFHPDDVKRETARVTWTFVAE